MRSSQANRNYMTEPPPRVFVSSVMEGYKNSRDAASEGIRQAGCEPVRAEDFPAATAFPRNSCLDGVRSADAVVLLLGKRYGFVGPSGLAATEEEYDQAQKNHMPIFVFLQDGEREAEQQKFINKVQGYVDGHWRKALPTFGKVDGNGAGCGPGGEFGRGTTSPGPSENSFRGFVESAAA